MNRRALTLVVVAALLAAPVARAQDAGVGSTQAQDEQVAAQLFADLVEKMKDFAKRLREHGQVDKAELVEKALGYSDEKKVAYMMKEAIESFRQGRVEEGKKLAGDLRSNMDDIIAILEKRAALPDLERKRQEIAESRKEIADLLAKETQLRKDT